MSNEEQQNEQVPDKGNANKPTFTHKTFPLARMRLGRLGKGFFSNPTYKTTHLCTYVVPPDGDETVLLDYNLDCPASKGGSIVYFLAEDSPKPTLYASQEIHPLWSQPDANGRASHRTTTNSQEVEDFWRRWHARAIELLKERAATKDGAAFIVRLMGAKYAAMLDSCLALPFSQPNYGDKHRLAGQPNPDASIQIKTKVWTQEVSKMSDETRAKHEQDVRDGKKILMIPGTDIVIYTPFYESIRGVRESREPITDYRLLKRYVYCKTPNENAMRNRGDMFSKFLLGAPSLVFNPAKNYEGTVSHQLAKCNITGFNTQTRNGAMSEQEYSAQQAESEDAMRECGFVQETPVLTQGNNTNDNDNAEDDAFHNKRLKRGDGTSLQLGTGHSLQKRTNDGSDDMGCDDEVAHQAWLDQQAYEDAAF